MSYMSLTRRFSVIFARDACTARFVEIGQVPVRQTAPSADHRGDDAALTPTERTPYERTQNTARPRAARAARHSLPTGPVHGSSKPAPGFRWLSEAWLAGRVRRQRLAAYLGLAAARLRKIATTSPAGGSASAYRLSPRSAFARCFRVTARRSLKTPGHVAASQRRDGR
jgi:hypothetical protein